MKGMLCIVRLMDWDKIQVNNCNIDLGLLDYMFGIDWKYRQYIDPNLMCIQVDIQNIRQHM